MNGAMKIQLVGWWNISYPREIHLRILGTLWVLGMSSKGDIRNEDDRSDVV